MNKDHRPWPVWLDVYDRCVTTLFPLWLKERGGVVVYENHMMDSSHFGDRTFLPAKYYAEEDHGLDPTLHDAPPRLGDVPSRLQERVDHITLEEFGGDMDKALACFKKEEPCQPTTGSPSRIRTSRRGRSS